MPPASSWRSRSPTARPPMTNLLGRSAMPSKKPLTVALIASLTLTSCSNSPPPSSVLLPPQPAVLPAELAVRCPPPVLPNDNSADAAVVALKTVYDQYGLCAGRLANIIQCIQGGSCGN